MTADAKVVAWRYRVGGDGRFEPGPWKLVHEEAECNFHPQYEREPLILQSDHLAEVRAAKDEGIREGIARAAAVVESEEELDGPIPDEVWQTMQTREGAERAMRAAVRATKRGIVRRLRVGGDRHA